MAVRLCAAGEEPVAGFIALAPAAPFHSGPETLLDRLNARDRVLPFERADDGAVMLVSRHDIDWVAPDPGVDPDRVGPHSYLVTREERVRIRLASGEELEGLIQMELPDTFNRTSDFLNGAEDFYALHTAEGPRLVNKLRIRHTRLYETSPMPAMPGGGERYY